ncbi:hypothetical protein C0Z01_02990 [Photobacterium kishitanii]|uniref:Uncharacterized protein n=1 Tax=Photobacterium kishitanii TaxID=318456 RepID=A0A2T3KC00_9GAMM|nr:hypothetical protein [Photobacterium kishitanii]OBU23803.1 hypothetical protein AYY22_05520 [Photobacterium kishitanii]PSU92533.1 hypothetical protein C9J27_22355 [Photobacterium kishitanii]PSU93013.1 hypothetical protein C0W35_13385 [Photobacterium kishitanii]PSV20447.1 hypothetical protein C0W28_09250 [Photobacterium kishitanii]PSW70942.1 hypothetical protein C0Z01_02990 [Photobacterium kishitanii]
MLQKNLRFIPLAVLFATSTAVHADGAIKQLHKVNKQLSHIEHTINGTQKKYNNTQRNITEIKEGTYAEKSVGRAVKNKKKKAVNSLIHRSNNAIRKATNSY